MSDEPVRMEGSTSTSENPEHLAELRALLDVQIVATNEGHTDRELSLDFTLKRDISTESTTVIVDFVPPSSRMTAVHVHASVREGEHAKPFANSPLALRVLPRAFEATLCVANSAVMSCVRDGCT